MESDDFQKAMQGTTKLDFNQAISSSKKEKLTDFNYRRQKAESDEVSSHNLSHFNRFKYKPDDIVGLKKPGVQEGVYRNLRLGKYSVQARLDLHQHTVEQASKALDRFIKDSLQYELRTVIIIHGKGNRGKADQGILKNMVIQWLEDIPEVLAFHSAQKADGGAGALYILLKKSDLAKQKNRERFGLR